MKRLLISLLTLGATWGASAIMFAPMASAETIACAAEVPAVKSGHWYYRIIDGRKCWYQGQAMLPKTMLYWPTSSDTEAQASRSKDQAMASEAQSPKPTTDGRNIGSATPSPTAESAAPAAWPAPVANEISFESRWLGLRSRN